MPAQHRSRLPADALVPGGARGGGGRIWIPWLLTPVFMLSPIAGCALAGKVRHSAIVPPPTPPTVTFEGASTDAPPTTFAPVAPALPVAPPPAD